MEHLEHLEGMLDRDQRTAKLRFFNSSDRQVPNTCSFPEKAVNESNLSPSSIISPRCCCTSRRKSSKSSYLTWKNKYLLNTFQSLKNVLIVVVCLYFVIVIPSASSAPIMDDRMNSKPKWINPCNLSTDTVPNSEIIAESSGADGDGLSKIGNQASIALTHAKSFRDNFTLDTFSTTYDAVDSLLEKQNIDFLMVSKDFLSEEIPANDPEYKKQINHILVEVYSFLQRVAVGMEQLVWFQEDNSDLFKPAIRRAFKIAEAHLRSVLCEIQMTIIDRGLSMNPDITRAVMTDEDRKKNVTAARTRDFIIFREYMNTLEYIEKVFSNMKK